MFKSPLDPIKKKQKPERADVFTSPTATTVEKSCVMKSSRN
jgi:hypothetical protein